MFILLSTMISSLADIPLFDPFRDTTLTPLASYVFISTPLLSATYFFPTLHTNTYPDFSISIGHVLRFRNAPRKRWTMHPFHTSTPPQVVHHISLFFSICSISLFILSNNSNPILFVANDKYLTSMLRKNVITNLSCVNTHMCCSCFHLLFLS